MRLNTALFIAFVAAVFVIGLVVGRETAAIAKLEPFKPLNVFGLSLDLLGLLVLTEFILASERMKAFVVTWVAGAVLWGLTVVPLGAWFGALGHSQGPSSPVVANFFIGLFAYAMLPLGVLDYTVFNPTKPMSQDRTQRTRRSGFFLLTGGVVVQLVAAFQDLYA